MLHIHMSRCEYGGFPKHSAGADDSLCSECSQAIAAAVQKGQMTSRAASRPASGGREECFTVRLACVGHKGARAI